MVAFLSKKASVQIHNPLINSLWTLVEIGKSYKSQCVFFCQWQQLENNNSCNMQPWQKHRHVMHGPVCRVSVPATNRPSRGQKIKIEKINFAYPKNTIRLNRCKYQRWRGRWGDNCNRKVKHVLVELLDEATNKKITKNNWISWASVRSLYLQLWSNFIVFGRGITRSRSTVEWCCDWTQQLFHPCHLGASNQPSQHVGRFGGWAVGATESTDPLYPFCPLG